MKLLYTLGVRAYGTSIQLVSLFNDKAKLWVDGRKNWRLKIQQKRDLNKTLIWFHCASLGEFEQARPVIEAVRKERKEDQILISFFSPSGYEIHENYEHGDIVCYLPLDVPSEVKDFIELTQPSIALFVKYEFWFNYLKELIKKEIPVSVFSAVFREDQIFFKPYGKWALDILKKFNHLYIQDKASLDLLEKNSVENVTIVGDTRFDRVNQIRSSIDFNDENLKFIQQFKGNKNVVVCGSSWEKEDEFLVRYINENKENSWKYIIAPHEINEDKIDRLIAQLEVATIKFSELVDSSPTADVLIVDGIGYLSRLYYFGNIAIIGGGFNDGIHNTLEPATFGMPILFGPKYRKYLEAVLLMDRGVGFSFNNYKEFESRLNVLQSNSKERNDLSNNCRDFVEENLGASKKISDYILSIVR